MANGLDASAPSPYTVSVGNETIPPFRRIRTAFAIDSVTGQVYPETGWSVLRFQRNWHGLRRLSLAVKEDVTERDNEHELGASLYYRMFH